MWQQLSVLKPHLRRPAFPVLAPTIFLRLRFNSLHLRPLRPGQRLGSFDSVCLHAAGGKRGSVPVVRAGDLLSLVTPTPSNRNEEDTHMFHPHRVRYQLAKRSRLPRAMLSLEALEARNLLSNVMVNNPAEDGVNRTQSETAIVLGSGSNVVV